MLYIYKDAWLNIVILFCFLLSLTHFTWANTTRPIIGVLAQEISPTLSNYYPEANSYIAASYVKFIEGAGARVVPIRIGKSKAYYRNILSKVNGVLWPGGATSFSQSNGYADAGYKIYTIATEMNEAGEYFPIFGICLGFELMTYVAANRQKFISSCDCNSKALPLIFKRGFRNSRLFKDAPSDVIDILKEKNVTINFHKYCVTEEDLYSANLENTFRVISRNRDSNNILFISSMEHVDMPFYGIQFHPEKNIYEWITNKNIPHGQNAIKVSQYFANFFVNECRKNSHRFSNAEEEMNRLIYNYSPVYTAPLQSSFMQVYLFS